MDELNVKEALKKFLNDCRKIADTEYVSLENACGRILVRDVTAPWDNPPFHVRRHGGSGGIRRFACGHCRPQDQAVPKGL